MSGRFHQATDLFLEVDTWSALYTSTSPETALAELTRHLTPELLPHLNGFRLSRIELALTSLVDLSDLEETGISTSFLTRDQDLDSPRQLAREIVRNGYEGLLVPSATALGTNLVIFPENLRASTSVIVVDSRDPRLKIEE